MGVRVGGAWVVQHPAHAPLLAGGHHQAIVPWSPQSPLAELTLQALVAHEPITPFIAKVRALLEERGASTVLVTGGSGSYLDVADRVVCMDSYVPHDVTAEARAICQRMPEPSLTLGDYGTVR